eukprot:Rhum_TRINITY_DN25299_c0_g2::Rhum_TRINITY_DN25299_c0_g2_i1::g.181467::m.181467/K07573/CSL4, EXOSC1; exosome complex component CSL4
MPKQAKEAKSPLEAAAGTFVLPGDLLCKNLGTSQIVGGEGTVRRGTMLCSTVAGRVFMASENVVSVSKKAKSSPVPYIGAKVLGRVKKVQGSLATVDILTIGESLCHTTFKGTIRGEDVRPASSQVIDNLKAVEIWRCVKPNDVVRAEIIGLGDQKSYQLSTTRKELGVVCAVSQAGHQMIPAGTGDMQCTGTGHIEPRKVALGGSDFWWL